MILDGKPDYELGDILIFVKESKPVPGKKL
jgi:hypothetical protein